MKERPILFSAPMVRAILDGSKTQTRRVVKLPKWLEAMGPDLSTAWPDKAFGVTPCLKVPCADGTTQRLRNKWYWPEPSMLWVRETWGARGLPHGDLETGEGCEVFYFATQPEMGPHLECWRPSIFMPRWASRIQLEITRVRVERLQEISEHDALNEGVDLWAAEYLDAKHGKNGGSKFACARFAYRELWESINGPGSWDLNPWVWVIEFKTKAMRNER